MQLTRIEKQIEKLLGGGAAEPAVAPNLFEYDNYRRYLKDFYAYEKARNKAFSHRYFSKRAGYRSSNFLKFVMDGKRNLTAQGIVNFSKALKLDASQCAFFSGLVRLNQAKTVEDRQQYAQAIMRSKAYKLLNPLAQAKFEYWSKWYHIPIREMVELQHFQEDPAWIANHINPPIAKDDASKAIDTLLTLGLLARTADGKLIQSEHSVTSGNEVENASIPQFHRSMIERALEAVDRFERQDRQISCVTLGLDEKTEIAIRERIHAFRKELLAMAQESQDLTRIVQVNFQLFPLTKQDTP